MLLLNENVCLVKHIKEILNIVGMNDSWYNLGGTNVEHTNVIGTLKDQVFCTIEG